MVAVIEGSRPLLVEIQALVAHSYLTSPRRMTTGVDHNRRDDPGRAREADRAADGG